LSEQIEISPEFCGQRLDLALSKLVNKSRSKISRWITSGFVSVNGKLVLKPAYKIEQEDLISLITPQENNAEVVPDSSIHLEIVHEDKNLLVVNKQAGLVVHPAAGNWSGTLVNGLAAYLGDELLNSSIRPGIVHRLDKNTSGLMVIAKTELALNSLSEQFLPPRQISREYLAITSRALSSSEGFIEEPIARDSKNRKKMAVNPMGKASKTNWKVLESFELGPSLVSLKLETGRTHQIRVHLAHIRAEIIGDDTYGPKINSLPLKLRKICLDFPRQALHAYKLSFLDPEGTKKRLSFCAKPPLDMQELIKKLSTLR